MMKYIPFNKPYLTGQETHYIYDAVNSGKISGNGKYTQLCQNFFESRYGFKKCLLTSSCTDALEMAAILLGVKEGDEIIMPSYTFVSTANAFVLRGATIVFVDSNLQNPNIDVQKIEALVTPKTKAIVVVHYAGIACDMDVVMDISKKYQLYVVEDAAQAIESFYVDRNGNRKPLGSIGHLAAFSFHETKNIISGEGGMLVVNDEAMEKRAEIIWEKGTNRSAFFRGEVDKYSWVDIGSSFLPSEIIAAFLWAQLENLDLIQNKRIAIWQRYNTALVQWANCNAVLLPHIPAFATNNAHMFYLCFSNIVHRTAVIDALKSQNVLAVFHYLSLHRSSFYHTKHDGRELPHTDRYADCLLRLPLFYELQTDDLDLIIRTITEVV
jgi:dTDP-4-amino-4,6-dideoxygalactose transaminase